MSYRKHLMPSNISPSAAYEATAVDSDTDTISRAKAIEALKDALIAWSYMPEWRDEKILEAIAELPSVEPERIRGRWIETGKCFPNTHWQLVYEVICDKCNGIAYLRKSDKAYIGANICPNCGAKMDGEVTE